MNTSQRLVCRLLAVVPALVVSPMAGASEPCSTCDSPAECITAPAPKIIVNVPPPEVVVQGNCGTANKCSKWGLFRHRNSACCAPTPVQQMQTVATFTTPLSTMTTGSLGMFGSAGVNMVAAAPSMAIVPNVMQQAQTADCGAFEGLRAIHSAEVRAASILAGRAQQDAELRSTMAALDRARGSMAAAVSYAEGNGTSQSVAAAVNSMSDTAATLGQRLDSLERRLAAVERDVRTMAQLQRDTAQKLAGPSGVAPQTTPPGGRQ